MRRTFNQFRVFLETTPYTAAATMRLSRRARAAIFVYRLSIRILAQWARDKCPQQAAALAFQTALSLVPVTAIAAGACAQPGCRNWATDRFASPRCTAGQFKPSVR